ncbi:PrpF domain-containing protein [Paraburkholderia xenovorans]|uniref:PrpF domain-containing protein n=1 Tax=Paraburkholderia xenovorans TaxID=36873 RepID=UPI0015C548F4
MTGTGAIVLAVAAAIPGAWAHGVAAASGWGAGPLRIGHPSGATAIAAEVLQAGSRWTVATAGLSRAACRLMASWVYVPAR